VKKKHYAEIIYEGAGKTLLKKIVEEMKIVRQRVETKKRIDILI